MSDTLYGSNGDPLTGAELDEIIDEVLADDEKAKRQPNRIEMGKFHPMTKNEVRLGITQQQILDEPRRCPNGHLCQLWPCLECNPQLGLYPRKKLGRKRRDAIHD